jgi:tetratricopeptide (TPR) repeat protein
MRFRLLRGHVAEGRKNIVDALALHAIRSSDIARAHALYVGAALADGQGDNVEALRMLVECLELRRKLGHPEDTAATLSTLSLIRLHAGDAARARADEEEAVAIFRELGNRTGEAIGHLHLGEICTYTSDSPNASRHFEQCLAIARDLGFREMEAECERLLGELSLDAGDLRAARERFERSLDVCRDAEDKRNEATALWWLGKVDLAADDTDSARVRLNEALQVFRDFEMNPELVGCLDDHAVLLQATGLADRAARLYAMITACRERITHTRPPHRDAQRKNAIDAARAALGEVAFETAWKAAQPCTLGGAVEYALAATARVPVTA